MTGKPEETALYHVYGDADLLLYIGVSNDFGRRWKEHAKKQPWWPEKRRLTTLWYDSREEAEAAETAAIKAEKPKYNKTHAVPPVSRPRRVAADPAAEGRRARVSPVLWVPLDEAGRTAWAAGGRLVIGLEREGTAGCRGILRLDARPSPPRWRCEHVHPDANDAMGCAYAEKRRRYRAARTALSGMYGKADLPAAPDSTQVAA